MPYESPNEYTTLLVEGVFGNSSLQQDLSEEAAAFFVEWAAQQAERIGQLPDDDDAYDDIKRRFDRSLRTMNALCKRRTEGADALEPLIARINNYGKVLQFEPLEGAARDELMAATDADDLAFMELLAQKLSPATAPDDSPDATTNDTLPSASEESDNNTARQGEDSAQDSIYSSYESASDDEQNPSEL
jgi:hypothetical protein